MKKNYRWIVSLVIGILLFAGAFVFYHISLNTSKYFNEKNKDFESSTGEVIEVIEIGEIDGKDTYNYIVEYKVGSYDENNEYKETTYTFETGDYTQYFKEGTRVRIKYNPENYDDGIIVRTVALEGVYVGVSSIMMVAGFAILINTAAILIRRNKLQLEDENTVHTPVESPKTESVQEEENDSK